jgi:hypothetical protein
LAPIIDNQEILKKYFSLSRWIRNYLFDSLNKSISSLQDNGYLFIALPYFLLEIALLYVLASFTNMSYQRFIKYDNDKAVIVIQKVASPSSEYSIQMFNKKYQHLTINKQVTIEDFSKNYPNKSDFLRNLPNDLNNWLQNLNDDYILPNITEFFYRWSLLKPAEKKRFFKLVDYQNTGNYLEKFLLSENEYLFSPSEFIIETLLGKNYLNMRNLLKITDTISVFEFWENKPNRVLLTSTLVDKLKTKNYLDSSIVINEIRQINGVSFEPLIPIPSLVFVFKMLQKQPRILDLYGELGTSLFAAVSANLPFRGFNFQVDYSSILSELSYTSDIKLNVNDFAEFNPNIILLHGVFDIKVLVENFLSIKDHLTKGMKMIIYYRDHDNQLIDALHSEMLTTMKYDGYIPVLFNDNNIRPLFIWSK